MTEAEPTEKTALTISSSTCTCYFGFLSQRDEEAPIPDECLTCPRMIDCRISEPEPTSVTAEELPDSSRARADQLEKVVEASLQQTPKPVEPEKPVEKTVARPDNDFCVQSPGMLYDQWSGTVLLSKETLQSLGKKVKEVEVQTCEGKRMKCKVYAVPDLALRVIQIPSKLKADLEVNDGAYVRVKSVGK